jgi:O-antigen ligase
MLPIIWFMLGSFTRLKPVMRIAIAIGVMAAFYFIQPFVPQSSIDRLSTVSTELEGGDLSGRRTIWDEGLEQFWNNPLLGTGSGAFKAAVNFKDKAAHNVYVSLLVEVGLIGLMLFGLVIAVSAYHTRYLPRWEAAFWLALIVSWLIGNYTGSWELKKHTWLFFSLVIVSANLLPQDESEAESGEVMVPPLAGTFPSRNGIPTRQNSYTYNPKL